jgi:hypothetical protein
MRKDGERDMLLEACEEEGEICVLARRKERGGRDLTGREGGADDGMRRRRERYESQGEERRKGSGSWSKRIGMGGV